VQTSARAGLQGFPCGQLGGGYNGGKSVHSPASTATTTTPGSSLSGRNPTPTRQDPLSSGRGPVPQRFAWTGQDKPAEQRMGQAPVPNQLKFDSPAGTGSNSGFASIAAPSGDPHQLSSRDTRPNVSGIEWSTRDRAGDRAGGTREPAVRPLRGTRSPEREPQIHGRGHQLQPPGVSLQQPREQVQQPREQAQAGNQLQSRLQQTRDAATEGQTGMLPPKVQQPSGQTQAGHQLQRDQPPVMSPPKVQQPSGQTQAGNSLGTKIEDLLLAHQVQRQDDAPRSLVRQGPTPSARGNSKTSQDNNARIPGAPGALLQGRDLGLGNQSAQNGGKDEPMMDKLQDANKKWFCEQEHSMELLAACANFMHLTLMPDQRTREHSGNAVRAFVEKTMTRCQYHNVHLVLALIYLQRYHESKSFKENAHEGDHIRDPWKALQKDLHVALHLAESWYPIDRDAPLKGTHVVRQSGLLGEVGEEKFPQVMEKKKGLYWEQWVICKALDWGFYVTREEFVQFGEKVHKDKAAKEAQAMIARSTRGGLSRGGMQINARATGRSCPASLNRGVNTRSEPTVQTGQRQEMLSPKGDRGNGEDLRPSDKGSDEDQDQGGDGLKPQYGVAPGRPMNGLGQAPRPCQPGQSKLPSRATVGGAPLASDMRRPEAVGNSNAGSRPGVPLSMRGREPGENGRSNVGSRMPQPPPFTSGIPPPVSSRGAAPRLEQHSVPNSSRATVAAPGPNSSRATGGPLSALDSSRGGAQGAQVRSSTDPGSRAGPQPGAAQGMNGIGAGGHTRTPPTSTHTPRPHAFTGSLSASRSGAAAPSSQPPGFSPYGAVPGRSTASPPGVSPARSSGITVNRGNPVQYRR